MSGVNPDGRWTPPNAKRVPMQVHPEARAALSELLWTPEFKGVGYSEFTMRAVAAARRGELTTMDGAYVSMLDPDAQTVIPDPGLTRVEAGEVLRVLRTESRRVERARENIRKKLTDGRVTPASADDILRLLLATQAQVLEAHGKVKRALRRAS